MPLRNFIFESLKLTNFPPKTGQAFMAAYCIPGRAVSIPYLIDPLTLGALSKRRGDFPISFQSLGCFSEILLGSGAGS